MMKCIVATDANFGIGYNNQLLFSIPEDMKFFRETTKESVVVMGRKTYDSIGKPLKNRTNFIITSKLDLKNNNEIISGSIDDIDRMIKLYKDQDIYIIGGGSIYSHYIDQCDSLLITLYDREYDNVDTYFPRPQEHGFHKDIKIQDGFHDGYYYSINEWIRS